MVCLTERGRGLAARRERGQSAANIGALDDGTGWLIGVMDGPTRRRLHRRLAVAPLVGRATTPQEQNGA
jgi:hypothetical protein